MTINQPRSHAVSRRRFLSSCVAAGSAGLGVSACGFAGPNSPGSGGGSGPQLLMAGWGSDVEKKNVGNAVSAFNQSGKHNVKYQYIPNDGYQTKMNTMVAANKLPDVSYQSEGFAMRLGSQDRLVNVLDHADKFPIINDFLPTVVHEWAPGKALTNLAVEMMMIWYGVDAITRAGIPTPPATANEAWSWDEFVGYLDKLTIDENGTHPSQAGYNPKRARQWGCGAPTGSSPLLPLLHSNGGGIINDDGTEFMLDRPESIEVLTKVHDLMYVHRVSPTPTQYKAFSATFTADLIAQGRLAMVLDGQWNLLDLGESDLKYDVAVLPKFHQPVTLNLCNALVISANSKNVDEAIELMLFLADPTKNDLFSKGLWMPLEKKYYTDPKAIASWTDNKVHPEHFKTAALDYLVNNAIAEPAYQVKNWDQISNIFGPDLNKYFADAHADKKELQKILAKTKQNVHPLLKGVYAKR